MSNYDLYSDGITGIGLVNGLIRVDFGRLSATQVDANNQPAMELSQRVVMTPDGFLRTFGAMQELINKLVEGGVLQVQQQPQQGQQQQAEATSANGFDNTSSPNFN